jgi:hypothetical protein
MRTVAPLTAQTPVARTPLTASVNGTRAAVDWAGPTPGVAPDGVVAQGPGTRVTADSDRTVYKPALALTGTFAVSAVFQRMSSASTAPYGLTLGSSERVASVIAFLVRPDGAVSVQRAGTTGLRGTWSPTAVLRAATPEEPAADRLEVRVQETTAAFFVNAQQVAVVPIAAGELDGSPGVHVGASGDVLVTTFTIEGRPSLFMK